MKGRIIPRKTERLFRKSMREGKLVMRTKPIQLMYTLDKSFMYDPYKIVKVTKDQVLYRHVCGPFSWPENVKDRDIEPRYLDENWKIYNGPVPTTREHFMSVLSIKEVDNG